MKSKSIRIFFDYDTKFQDVTYEIRVKTSNYLWGGTDDKISIKLVGSTATSDWIKLPNKASYFERGNTDTIKLNHFDLGILRTVSN